MGKDMNYDEAVKVIEARRKKDFAEAVAAANILINYLHDHRRLDLVEEADKIVAKMTEAHSRG